MFIIWIKTSIFPSSVQLLTFSICGSDQGLGDHQWGRKVVSGLIPLSVLLSTQGLWLLQSWRGQEAGLRLLYLAGAICFHGSSSSYISWWVFVEVPHSHWHHAITRCGHCHSWITIDNLQPLSSIGVSLEHLWALVQAAYLGGDFLRITQTSLPCVVSIWSTGRLTYQHHQAL